MNSPFGELHAVARGLGPKALLTSVKASMLRVGNYAELALGLEIECPIKMCRK